MDCDQAPVPFVFLLLRVSPPVPEGLITNSLLFEAPEANAGHPFLVVSIFEVFWLSTVQLP